MTSTAEQLRWEDVSEAAAAMFHVWQGGGELAWAEECWQHLTAAGLTPAGTVLETTATCLRLVELARIYEAFSGLAWDENPHTPVTLLAENLAIDPLALGIIAAASTSESFAACVDPYELYQSTLHAAAGARRAEIFQCLVEAYDGEINLYSRLSKTNQAPDAEDDEDALEPTFPNVDAFAYVQNGFQHD